ncbi:PAS domain S-box protein [Sneathiella limimaris]|uniref:PAS domain S-box protein n=1 Tax=Sneathiella limimaris TaxID=1964213 RepID=UPI00146D426F|nr:PAS domain S-box protein [Sneathiella limimaris]
MSQSPVRPHSGIDLEQVHNLLHLISSPACLVTPNLQIEAGNLAFETLVNSNGQGLQNHSVQEFLDPETCSKIDAYLKNRQLHAPLTVQNAKFTAKTQTWDVREASLAAFQEFFILKLDVEAEITKDMFRGIGSSALVHSLLETIPAPVFCKDANHIYTACNEEFLQFHGFKREDVIGKNVFEVAPENMAKVFREADEELFARGGRQIYETQTQRVDGVVCDVMFHKSVINDSEGNPLGLIGISLDITKRKDVERQLEETKNLLTAVIDHSPAHIFIKDLNGIYQLASDELVEKLDVETKVMVGRNDDELFPPEIAKSFIENDKEVIRSKKPITERTNLPYQGSTIHYLTVKFPLLDQNDEIIGVAGIATDITDLKNAEDQLQLAADNLEEQVNLRTKELSEEVKTRKQAEQNIHEILSISPIGVGVADLKSSVITMENQALVDQFGGGENSLVGKLATDRWKNIEDQKIFVKNIRKYGNFEFSEVELVRFNGEVFPGKIYGKILDREDAEYIVFWVVDLTEEKQILEKIENSEKALREMLAVSPVALGISDVQSGEISLVNESLCRLLGIPEAELIGNTTFQFWRNQEDRDAFVKEFRETGKVKPQEMLIQRYTGEPIWVLISWTGIKIDNQKKIVFWLNDISQIKEAEAVLRESHEMLEKRVQERTEELEAEIQERRKIETALRKSEEQFEAFATSASDWFWGTDENLRFNHLSDRFTEMTGLSREEVLGQQRFSVVDRIGLDGELADHKETLLKHLPFRDFRYSISREDGEIFYVSISGIPIHDHLGNFKGYRGAGRDITHEKMAEEQAREMEEKLHQSQKMEAIGQLTGGVAHDFNNILAVILGNVELANEKLEKDTQLNRHLRAIENSALKGAQLTERLLAYSRKQELRPVEIQLNSLVKDILTLIDRLLGETIRISTHFSIDIPPVFADSHQLENALMNLCINSRDAMPDGGWLEIRTGSMTLTETTAAEYSELKPGTYSWLEVEDSGKGMSEETLEKVFEPFFTTKEVGKGTGLGLSMIYGFAHQSNGTVTMQSTPGKGTRARIILPSYLTFTS